MRGGPRFDSCSCRACNAVDNNIAVEHSCFCKRDERQLYRRGEASWISDFRGRTDSAAVHFRKTIDIPLGFIAEILCEIDHFQPVGPNISIPEFGAFAVPGTKKDDIDGVERMRVGEPQSSVAEQSFVNIRYRIAGVAGRMDPV